MGDRVTARCLVRYPERKEELPIIAMADAEWTPQVVIWVDPAGKQALFDHDGKPKPAVEKLLSAGVGVIGADLFGQGEFTADGKPMAKTRLAKSGRGTWAGYAGYTFGYNHPVFSKRVHDILSLVALAKTVGRAEKVHLVGFGGAGHWVAAARAQAGDAVDRAVVDTAGFRFADVTAFDDPDFLPGGAKYLDLPGILALSAPGELWLAGEGPEAPETVAAAYRAAGSQESLTVFDSQPSEREQAALDWLLR